MFLGEKYCKRAHIPIVYHWQTLDTAPKPVYLTYQPVRNFRLSLLKNIVIHTHQIRWNQCIKSLNKKGTNQIGYFDLNKRKQCPFFNLIPIKNTQDYDTQWNIQW